MSKVDKRFIEGIDHHALKNIQGGKVEGGKVTEAYHLTKDQWEGLPVRPSIISPANGETNINQVPQIVGTPYAHPYDTLMYMKHIQIAKTSDFAAPVYDKEEVSRNVTFQVPLKLDNSPYLEENTLYYVRIRYRDRRMRWSRWSAPVKFTTMQTFPQNVIAMPEMIIPADGGEASAFSPLLAMSTPQVVGGVGEFDKADWQVSTDSTFATTLYDAQGTDDLVTHVPRDLNLSIVQASDFYARGRQRMTGGQYSPWARPVRFGLRPEFDDPIFGVRRIFSKKHGIAMLSNIDENGETVYIPMRYWNKHPLYLFLRQDVTLWGDVVSEMVYVMPCWIKYRVYDNDDGDMVIDLWFSAQQKEGDGWMLHPAFKRSPNGFLHAVHPAKGVSAPSAEYVYVSNPAYGAASVEQKYMNNLNKLEVGSENGPWHFASIYELRLISDLITAEMLRVRFSNISSPFSWRKFRGLFQWESTPYYGVSFRGTPEKCTFLLLSSPEMSSVFHEIPLDLPYGTGQNVTKVLRGEHAGLGFDLALFGIASAVGSTPSPFEINNVRLEKNVVIAAQTSCLPPLSLGLYGLASLSHSNGNVRLSKWLD